MNSTLEFISNRFGVDVSTPVVRITQINRTIIAQVFNELGFKVGAEIGVAEGIYSKILFDNIPGLKLYLTDIWKSYPGYSEYKNPEQIYEDAKERLKSYNSVFIRKFSMDAVRDFADNSLDFVFIDGAHDFKNVACDICEWSRKVKIGGIVFGHDDKYHQAFIQKTRHGHTKQRSVIEVKLWLTLTAMLVVFARGLKYIPKFLTPPLDLTTLVGCLYVKKEIRYKSTTGSFDISSFPN